MMSTWGRMLQSERVTDPTDRKGGKLFRRHFLELSVATITEGEQLTVSSDKTCKYVVIAALHA